MKKKLLSVSLAAVMALSMTACGSTAVEAPAETPAATTEAAAETTAATEAAGDAADYEECEISFDWWGGDSRHEATLAAIEAFQAKYPGITVKYNYGAWTDYETARALEFQSKTAADVNQINFNWIGDYDADGSVFLDLNTVSDTLDLSQWGDEYLDMMKDVNGGLAAVPVSMTGRIFYWDKTTFDEAGIEIPKSLADLRAAGKTFAEKLGDDYYPLALGPYDRMIMATLYLQSKLDQPIIADGTFNYTEEQLKDGLDFIQSLEDDHVIPSLETIDGDAADSFDVNEKFISGKYAGILEWDSAPKKYVSALGDARELVVGEEFTDFGGKSTGVFYKVSMAMAISTTCEHPKEAAMLINYLLNDPEGVAIMATERGIPQSEIAVKTLSDADALDPLILEAHNKVMDSAAFALDPKFEDSGLKSTDNGVYKDAFDGISYGDYTTEEAAGILFDAFTEVCQ
ncbi:MAG: ABC transporter substrate-binding protein [Lachnospiraceae bacterium]|nr:ABC transporter substrate-binding protein [Lachnospiraceae bacterium]